MAKNVIHQVTPLSRDEFVRWVRRTGARIRTREMMDLEGRRIYSATSGTHSVITAIPAGEDPPTVQG